MKKPTVRSEKDLRGAFRGEPGERRADLLLYRKMTAYAAALRRKCALKRTLFHTIVYRKAASGRSEERRVGKECG